MVDGPADRLGERTRVRRATSPAGIGQDERMDRIPSTATQLRSLVEADGTLHLSLQTVDVPAPGDNEVLVRVDAAPINPSDLGLLFGGADMAAASFEGSGPSSTVTAPIA